MIKILMGGSPCTHWSIAQSKNRETKAEGIGWELFLNYVIAKEKFKPDFFLYENNWSASKEIKEQIQQELGYPLIRINSNLVSAQNRDRFYVCNWENEQPKDRGILLKDILQTGEDLTGRYKSYCITATEYKGSNPGQTIKKHRRTMVAEAVPVDGEKFCLKNGAEIKSFKNGIKQVYKGWGAQGSYIITKNTKKAATLSAAYQQNR